MDGLKCQQNMNLASIPAKSCYQCKRRVTASELTVKNGNPPQDGKERGEIDV